MRLSIIIILSLAILYSNCQTKPPNLAPLISIDFENNPLHEQNFTMLLGKAVSSNVFEGKKSFRLDGKGEPFALHTYLHPGKIYKVSVWTNLRPDENEIWLSAKTKDNGRKSLFAENSHSRFQDGWYHLELLLNTSWGVNTQKV